MDYTSHIFSKSVSDVHEPIFIDADDPTRTINWQQYVSSVKRLAIGLRRLGVAEDECVLAMSQNEIYLSVLIDGIIAAGGVFSTCYSEGKHSELVGACTVARVKWIFVAPELLDKTLAVARDLNIPDQNVLVFDPPGLESKLSTYRSERPSFSSLIASSDEHEYVNHNVSQDATTKVAARLFTSGTTGAPKAADTTHDLCVKRAEGGVSNPNPSDIKKRYLHVIGMHHGTGLSNTQKVAAGKIRMFITKASAPADVIDRVKQHQATSTMLPPRTMISVTEAIKDGTRSKDSIQSLSEVFVAGTSVADERMDAFRSLLPADAVLKTTYGATETGAVSFGNWDHNPREASGYVGHVFPGMQVRIIDPETEQVFDKLTDGEIIVRGTQEFSGYFGNQKATEALYVYDAEGLRWIRTGDKGRLGVDGALYITGRYKEIFKVATEEVAPAEVEAILSQYPGINDVAITPVTSRDDPKYPEVKAWVVKKEGYDVVPQELVNYVSLHLSPHKAPTGGVTFVDQIPRNTMQKVIQRDLEAMRPRAGSMGFLDMQT